MGQFVASVAMKPWTILRKTGGFLWTALWVVGPVSLLMLVFLILFLWMMSPIPTD